MPASQKVKLNTGAFMPTLGFGTWQAATGETRQAVKTALEVGFRSIDTATAYGNEKEVGEGIKASGIPREEIFLCTKLNNYDHRNASEALEYSLKQLDTPYLDLWLMHWPAPMKRGAEKVDKEWHWQDTWKHMEELHLKHPDKLKAIGVSNFSVPYMEQLLKVCKVVPAVNQIELHAGNNQEGIVKFCREKGIVLTAYSPLASGYEPILKDPTVHQISEKYGVSPAVVLTSLQANREGVTVLTKSVTESRIRSNFKLIDLTDEEIKKLVSLEETKFHRVCTPEWTGHGHLGFPDRMRLSVN